MKMHTRPSLWQVLKWAIVEWLGGTMGDASAREHEHEPEHESEREASALLVPPGQSPEQTISHLRAQLLTLSQEKAAVEERLREALGRAGEELPPKQYQFSDTRPAESYPISPAPSTQRQRQHQLNRQAASLLRQHIEAQGRVRFGMPGEAISAGVDTGADETGTETVQ